MSIMVSLVSLKGLISIEYAAARICIVVKTIVLDHISVFLISTMTKAHNSLLVMKTKVFSFHRGLSFVPL